MRIAAMVYILVAVNFMVGSRFTMLIAFSSFLFVIWRLVTGSKSKQ